MLNISNCEFSGELFQSGEKVFNPELSEPLDMPLTLQRDICSRIPDYLTEKYAKLSFELLNETKHQFKQKLHEIYIRKRYDINNFIFIF